MGWGEPQGEPDAGRLDADAIAARRAEPGRFTRDTALRWPCDCGHLAGHHLPAPFMPCGRCDCAGVQLGLVDLSGHAVPDIGGGPPVASRDAKRP